MDKTRFTLTKDSATVVFSRNGECVEVNDSRTGKTRCMGVCSAEDWARTLRDLGWCAFMNEFVPYKRATYLRKAAHMRRHERSARHTYKWLRKCLLSTPSYARCLRACAGVFARERAIQEVLSIRGEMYVWAQRAADFDRMAALAHR